MDRHLHLRFNAMGIKVALSIFLGLSTGLSLGSTDDFGKPNSKHEDCGALYALIGGAKPSTDSVTHYSLDDLMKAARSQEMPIVEIEIQTKAGTRKIKGALLVTPQYGNPKEFRILGEDGTVSLIDPYDLRMGRFVDFGASILGSVPRNLRAFAATAERHVVDLRSPAHESELGFANSLQSQANNPFAKRFLYAFFRQNPGIESQLLNRWYGNDAKAVIAKLSGLGKDYVVLGLDPGIICRLDEFVAFSRHILSQPQFKGLEPYELRTQFENHLRLKGQKSYFRAVWLTDKEASTGKPEGLFAPGQIHPDNIFKIRAMFDPNSYYRLGPKVEVDRRLGPYGDRSISLLQSFSAYPEVSAAVAYYDVEHPPGKKLFMMEVKLSPLSVIQPEGLLKPSHDAKLDTIDMRLGSLLIPGIDPGIEVFSPFGVDATEIIKIVPVEGVPAKYTYESKKTMAP